MRIGMQLIECSTGHHLWVKRFDRELTNVFEVQDEIARNVASTLAVKLRLACDAAASTTEPVD